MEPGTRGTDGRRLGVPCTDRETAALIESLPVGVVIADEDGRVVEKNNEADRIWGGTLPMPRSLSEYDAFTGWWADTGEQVRPEEWPLALAVSKGEVSGSRAIDIRRPDGTLATILNSAAPIIGDSGGVVGASAVFRDVTERRHREKLSSALADIEAVVASELDVRDVLDHVLSETARTIEADSAVIYTRRAGLWVVQRTYGRAQGPIGRAVTDEEMRYVREYEPTRGLVAITDTSTDDRVDRALAARNGVGALVDGAVFLRDEVVAHMTFGFDRPRSRFSEAELDFIRDVTFAVSQSVKTAAQFQGDREVANAMQRALLQMPEAVPGIEYAFDYTSASEIAEVGGDFYDLLPLPGRRVAVVIGDVSGHALQAAMLMMTVKNAIRAYAFDGHRPADALRKANELLAAITASNIFVTVFLGILDLDSAILTYCSAGHPPAFLRRASGEVVLLAVQSPLLGSFAEFEYVQGDETLERDDYLFLYTDGAYEAHRDGEMFGTQRLAEVVMGSASGHEACERVSRAVTAFSGGRLADDLAILTVGLARPAAS